MFGQRAGLRLLRQFRIIISNRRPDFHLVKPLRIKRSVEFPEWRRTRGHRVCRYDTMTSDETTGLCRSVAGGAAAGLFESSRTGRIGAQGVVGSDRGRRTGYRIYPTSAAIFAARASPSAPPRAGARLGPLAAVRWLSRGQRSDAGKWVGAGPLLSGFR